MPAPANGTELLDLIRKSGLVSDSELAQLEVAGLPETAVKAANLLIKKGCLTRFQANHLVAGRHRGLVIGPYQLLDMIGKGGVGLVFIARHAKLHNKVAIKVLAPNRSQEKDALARFLREGRAIAALNHPNIVGGLEANRWGKLYYLVMEYVEGVTLQKFVDEKRSIPLGEATNYISQVASGLEHAHRQGLVHRDIKPANLLLDRQGVVKILDMGLARFFEDNDDSVTEDFSKGALLGTADYISPEQALRFHAVDIRADIYSLGATFYALLLGRPPFQDSNLIQKLMDHQQNMPPAPHIVRPEIPPELSAIVFKMMAKDPKDRYGTPLDVLKALATFKSAKKATVSDIELQDLTETTPLAWGAGKPPAGASKGHRASKPSAACATPLESKASTELG